MDTHNITWRGIGIEITFTPEQFGIVDHIKLRAEGRQPLPLTGTGYRSHFMPAGTVDAHGGAVAFVAEWVAH